MYAVIPNVSDAVLELRRKHSGSQRPIEQFGDEWRQHIRIVFEKMRWKWVGGALLDRKLADGVDDVINAENAERWRWNEA